MQVFLSLKDIAGSVQKSLAMWQQPPRDVARKTSRRNIYNLVMYFARNS